MLEKIRFALRIDGNDFDAEIQDLISACKDDLRLSGVDKILDTDPLITRAIITYCRAYFDVTNQDYDKFVNAYNSLKQHLSLSYEYKVVTQ